MEKYNEYKDSGIEWLLDKIPSHWEVKRVKDLCRMQSGFYISANDFQDSGFPIYGGNGFRGFSENYNHDGDYTLVGRQGALCGNINYAKGKFWATEHAIVVYEKKDINKLWFGELLRLMDLNQYSLSAAQPGLSVEKIKRLKLPFVSSLKEQTQIANYLDAKTTLIDKKIKLLQQKIKHYKAYRKTLINETVTKGLDKTVKLKDSGIEWIGPIPEHWEVKRFKEICYKNHTGGTPSTSNTDMFRGDNIWVTIADMKKDDLVFDSKLKLTDEAIKTSNIPITPKGSLLYSFKLTLGKIAFAAKDIYTNEAIISILPNKNIVLRYHYYMLPIYLLLNATENIYGAKMLNQKLISNALLLHPTIKEQQQIADFLDAKTTTIDNIINNIETQITTLKELRKTLINEVVTGKVKVTA
ncbi:restriction endonuclease subunit S [Xanthomarina gelatinilytica]|uniref:restriction endonuclease subunit S n=1 Tax=Xanthomarina gelatinilytica TaxID=1137281 RepID=UPI003AA9301A